MVTHPAMTLKGHLATDNVAGSDLQLMIMEKRAKWESLSMTTDNCCCSYSQSAVTFSTPGYIQLRRLSSPVLGTTPICICIYIYMYINIYIYIYIYIES